MGNKSTTQLKNSTIVSVFAKQIHMETTSFTIPSPPINAVITGATGTLGSEVVRECAEDPRFSRVTVLTRGDMDFKHEKLRVIKVSDFNDLSSVAEDLKNHHICYWCLGVSTMKVSDEKLYREITIDYAVHAATLLNKLNPNFSFFYVSGQGADPTMKSKVLFARAKGEAEVTLAKLGIPRMYIWRPGYIKPMRYERQMLFSERALGAVANLLYKVAPSIGTNGIEISKAFFEATFNSMSKSLFENKDIRELAKRASAK